MRPNVRKVDEPVNLAKQVTVGDVPLQTEAIEQRLLHHTRTPSSLPICFTSIALPR